MSSLQKATFAGGCFWCMVKPFDQFDGIEQIRSGYTGGEIKNPTYEQVKEGNSGHQEAVEILFDPSIFPYEKLLEIYWQQVDPTDDEGQFQDRGTSYRASIFYHNEEQKQLAEQSRKNLEESGKYKNPVITPILPAAEFYEAEEYHQDFYKKNPDEYKKDREQSGRNEFISKHWR
ncbi:peptide-methionine (S)-S-oxide reductase MsrA [Jeotgalibacillus proteolyticus]|uniref:Peptide methionine sulfoxide reductase MsrA n=1 Tax=Jeotgalibacillus proteolyticus TaxID=2082395 RepID=A0A2S5GFR2_9BACL|nr:peptide-methionine (S)-S-oxide reductase MsrA [Jeotgalibacillus proteolyticus]PPA71867.1 peptide-methionine (S)-S-oxide reductase [Jeotgalibacillus proteolyticus]